MNNRYISTLTICLGLGFLASTPWLAKAGGWSDFVAAFPINPCQDGWLGCITADGEMRSSEMVKDGDGRPTPTDLRVSWDLQPTASFSPFSELSKYTGKLKVAKAGAGAGGKGSAGGKKGGGSKSGSAGKGSDSTGRAGSDAVASSGGKNQNGGRGGVTKVTTTTPQTATTPQPTHTTAPEQTTVKQPEVVEEAPVEQEVVEVVEVVEAVVEAVVEEAPVADTAKPEADGDGAAALEIATDIEEPSAPATCDDLLSMQVFASVGELEEGLIACLEDRYQSAGKQTEKNKVSRLLMADAWGKGDRSNWEKLVVRHFEEVDQSDPDLCYKYATQLARKGPSRAKGVIRWSGVALENKTRWIGDKYTRNVYQLYKLRTAAAMNLWGVAQTAHTESPDDSSFGKSESARNQAKVMAREWYDYAKQAGKDPTKAKQACVSAAGGTEYCEGR